MRRGILACRFCLYALPGDIGLAQNAKVGNFFAADRGAVATVRNLQSNPASAL